MTISPLKNHTDHPVYFVILAGGNGERLWPLSRKNKPKQLLSLYGNKTLLEQAIERVQLIAHSKKFIWVTTSAHHEQAVRACVEHLVGTILVEPSLQNTAAAVIFTCETIYAHNPLAHIVFLPADPFIPSSEYPLFIESIQQALTFIETKEAIVLFGVQPTYPATEYGYIEYLPPDPSFNKKISKVSLFHEKPSYTDAQLYVKNPHMLWNLSMFCASVQTFLKEAEMHCPAIVHAVRTSLYNPEYYHTIDAQSIDKAIIEKSNKIWVISVPCIWYDVGNVAVFLSLKELSEKNQPNVIYVNAHNNLVEVHNKLVALIDVDNLCIVETEDALLISKRDTVENIKNLISVLKKEGRNDYL